MLQAPIHQQLCTHVRGVQVLLTDDSKTQGNSNLLELSKKICLLLTCTWRACVRLAGWYKINVIGDLRH